MAPDPVIKAIVVCDLIYQDPVTRRLSLLGVVTDVFVAKWPYQPAGMCVYVVLADMHGTRSIGFQIVHAEDGKIVCPRQDVPVGDQDPAGLVQCIAPFQRPSFPSDGVYAAQVYCNQTLLSEVRFAIIDGGKHGG